MNIGEPTSESPDIASSEEGMSVVFKKLFEVLLPPNHNIPGGGQEVVLHGFVELL